MSTNNRGLMLMVAAALLMTMMMSAAPVSHAFVPVQPRSRLATALATAAQDVSSSETKNEKDEDDIVARRIVLTGDVQGGYYRSCVLNEAGRFRRLVGTMSPPDDTDEAEIYVEGKKKMVDGFVRWCQKSDVGLNQIIKVKEVLEEDPTGLYDEFYVKTK